VVQLANPLSAFQGRDRDRLKVSSGTEMYSRYALPTPYDVWGGDRLVNRTLDRHSDTSIYYSRVLKYFQESFVADVNLLYDATVRRGDNNPHFENDELNLGNVTHFRFSFNETSGTRSQSFPPTIMSVLRALTNLRVWGLDR